MRDNNAIREEAWRLLWKRNWFWKLTGATLLLQACSQVVVGLVNEAVYRLGVFNVTVVLNLMKRDQPMPHFSPRLIWELTSSTLLYLFFAIIMGAIAVYGISVLLLRSTEDKSEGWLKAAFGGFKIPLDLGGLSLRLTLVYVGWSFLAAVPCLVVIAAVETCMPASSGVSNAVSHAIAYTLCAAIYIAVLSSPFYRYRYLFRIKAEHADWTAGACMKSCREMTNGRKWRIFLHDCSYWRIALVTMIFLCVLVADILITFQAQERSALAGVLSQLFNNAFVVSLIIAMQYIGVGQTILYREISREKTSPVEVNT